MHSGVGSADQLKQFGIPLVYDLPPIGQGLQDHFVSSLVFQRNPETNDRSAFFGNKAAMDSETRTEAAPGLDTFVSSWERSSSRIASHRRVNSRPSRQMYGNFFVEKPYRTTNWQPTFLRTLCSRISSAMTTVTSVWRSS